MPTCDTIHPIRQAPQPAHLKNVFQEHRHERSVPKFSKEPPRRWVQVKMMNLFNLKAMAFFGFMSVVMVLFLVIASVQPTAPQIVIIDQKQVSNIATNVDQLTIGNLLPTLDSLEPAYVTEAEFDQINISAISATAQTADELYLASMKHKDSVYVAKALLTLASQGMLNAKGDCRSSGSLCMWGGANFQTMTGSIAITFVAGKRITYTVITGPLIQPTAAMILSNKALVKLAEGYYMDTSVATWTISLILSVGGTTGKAYNPSEPISFGAGWASWEYKQQQYGLYIPIAGIVLPTPPTLH